MAVPASEIIDINHHLLEQERKQQLRFITCGSVDDGKSTLLGRLLHDSKSLFDDQLLSAKVESRKYGTQGESVDLALLVDGLQAEREQGITIDVAYHFFETDKRKFIAADTPGHEQYTRNMVTAVSTAELVIILVDARQGITTQTRRHSAIISMLGVKHVVLAINKMDLIDYSESIFYRLSREYDSVCAGLNFRSIVQIPVSALTGENVFSAAESMPWYSGSTLISVLNDVDTHQIDLNQPFRLPVQWVNRPNSEFRGYCGTIASGTISQGEQIASSLSDRSTVVKKILGPTGELSAAQAGQSVTLLLDEHIDISRGDVLAMPDQLPEVADQFAAHIVWMNDEPMLPERRYVIRFATAISTARVTDLTYRIDVEHGEKLAAKTLALNEIGYCKFAVDNPVAFDAYSDNRKTGSFVLIDTYSNATVAASVIDFALRRATNISWHPMKVDKALRAHINGQKPCVLWFTGLSGAGKSTVADRLEQKLIAMGKRTYLLDGDNVRYGINKDLGFTDQDRVENIRRVAEIAKLMVDAGLVVLVSFISPFRSERQMARELVDSGEFVEVHVDAPIEVCETRDPKGLYKKARAGEIRNFTGIDSDYEVPRNPELTLKTAEKSVDVLADQGIEFLKRQGDLS